MKKMMKVISYIILCLTVTRVDAQPCTDTAHKVVRTQLLQRFNINAFHYELWLGKEIKDNKGLSPRTAVASAVCYLVYRIDSFGKNVIEAKSEKLYINKLGEIIADGNCVVKGDSILFEYNHYGGFWPRSGQQILVPNIEGRLVEQSNRELPLPNTQRKKGKYRKPFKDNSSVGRE